MLSQYEENLKNERLEKGQLSEEYENRIQMLNSVRALFKFFSLIIIVITAKGLNPEPFDKYVEHDRSAEVSPE